MEEIKQKEGMIVHFLSAEIIERPSVLLECYGFLPSDHHLTVLCHLRGSDSWRTLKWASAPDSA